MVHRSTGPKDSGRGHIGAQVDLGLPGVCHRSGSGGETALTEHAYGMYDERLLPNFFVEGTNVLNHLDGPALYRLAQRRANVRVGAKQAVLPPGVVRSYRGVE